jgi:hypothetical protein
LFIRKNCEKRRELYIEEIIDDYKYKYKEPPAASYVEKQYRSILQFRRYNALELQRLHKSAKQLLQVVLTVMLKNLCKLQYISLTSN